MPRRLSLLVLAACALGVLAALLGPEGRAATTTPPPPPAPAPMPVAAPLPAVPPPHVPRPVVPCIAGPREKGAPPSRALLDAFRVLRREARPEDALSKQALDALRRHGLAPVDPASARLLRTTPAGGKAWVVPVPDVGRAGLLPVCVNRRGAKVPKAPRMPKPPAPREGLAVVALGGAPVGGGGALADLVRGRGAVGVDPCAGPDRDMLGVSGIVPDGVPAAFLTSPDGTAVRADVVDNGYAFVVPRTKRFAQRYVVWTGADGTPHVQPVQPVLALNRGACPVPERIGKLPQVSPGPFAAGCVTWIVPRKIDRRPRPVKPPPPPPAPLLVRCLAAPAVPARPGIVVPARPPRPPAAPLPARPPSTP